MRIAVIGAGVSGLTAAYLLRRTHAVSLFEAESRAGGHANTVTVTGRGGDQAHLDVGFIVYNERTYPAFTRLLAELGVETQASDMSFSVRCEETGLEFSSRGVRGYLAQPANAFRPKHARMLLDLWRFHREARRAIERDELHELSFGEFLRMRRYSQEFMEHLMIPLAASTWSNAPADILTFPCNYLFRFLEQHGVLAINAIPQWRWIKGGARSYVDAVLARLDGSRVHVGAPVTAVTRGTDGVVVQAEGERAQAFDAVVLATHPGQSLAMLTDASDEERAGLSSVVYAPNRVVLHDDPRVLPRREAARASWNYTHARCGPVPAQLTMSYDLVRLQGMRGPERHYCVSVNPGSAVAPERVIAAFDYEHPVYSPETLLAQRRIEALQGGRRTYFAGAYLGYGFHEDGVQSGVRVAARLGVEW
ncbi:MAG: NAD(P)/FAD-dependent oxidoreductase [Dehalococcoidia bacterium]